MGSAWNSSATKARIAAAVTLAVAVAAGALASGAGASNRHAAAAPQARASELRAVEISVFSLLNAERRNHGLRPLHRSTRLDRAAGWQSRDMVRRHYFAHRRPGGPKLVKRVRRTGYLHGAWRWIVGENIAWGLGSMATPRSIVYGWMHSPEHRSNILYGPFRNIGIGTVAGNPRGDQGAVTITTDFGLARR
jgi:uncharacterized protein YkwD